MSPKLEEEEEERVEVSKDGSGELFLICVAEHEGGGSE